MRPEFPSISDQFGHWTQYLITQDLTGQHQSWKVKFREISMNWFSSPVSTLKMQPKYEVENSWICLKKVFFEKNENVREKRSQLSDPSENQWAGTFGPTQQLGWTKMLKYFWHWIYFIPQKTSEPILLFDRRMKIFDNQWQCRKN